MPPEEKISVTLSRKQWGLLLFTLEDPRTCSPSEKKRLHEIWAIIDQRLEETLSASLLAAKE